MRTLFAFLLTGFLLVAGLPIWGQSIRKVVPYTQPTEVRFRTGEKALRLAIRNQENILEEGGNPVWNLTESGTLTEYVLLYAQYKPLTTQERAFVDSSFLGLPQTEVWPYTAMHESYTQVRIRLVHRNPNTGQLERLVAFSPKLTYKPQRGAAARVAADSAKAVWPLASGKWGKIGITQTGVFKLTAGQLQKLGLNTGTIDPRKLHVFGRGGEPLPDVVGAAPVGLHELAISVVGEGDGKFDGQDYVLFYAEGPATWRYNPTTKRFEHATTASGYLSRDVHPYADTIQFIVGVNDAAGLRIDTAAATANPSTVLSAYTSYQVYEKETTNLLKGGRRWFADVFDLTKQKDYNFVTPRLVAGETATLRMLTAARSVGGTSTSGPTTSFDARIGGGSVANTPLTGVFNGPFGSNYNDGEVLGTFTQTAGNNVLVSLSYNKSANADAVGYLDFFELATRQAHTWAGTAYGAWYPEMAVQANAGFSVEQAPASLQAWSVDASLQPQVLPRINGVYALKDSTPGSVYVFSPESAVAPISMGAMANQSLATEKAPALLIIAAPQFLTQAQALADYRISKGISAKVVVPAQIYNEFTGGHADLTAIRDYLYTLYNQPGSQLKYVLLFGRASFDYKNRVANNTSFVPTYESPLWDNPIDDWPSDDYIVALSEGAGKLISGGYQYPSLAVGRLPVLNKTHADAVLAKIIAYESDSTGLGSWRNINTFVADNGDGNTHTGQSDSISKLGEAKAPPYLPDKYYLAAYPLIAGPGGLSSPQMKSDLQRRIRSGSLIVNYTGHGSELQWADERIFDSESINTFDNSPRLPFFITATCEFGRMDDPAVYSNGEGLVTFSNGGAISVFSAARPVYSSSNYALHSQIYQFLFTPRSDGEMPTIGEVVQKTKNQSGGRAQYFYFLFGDPSLRLAYPRHQVVVTALQDGDGHKIDTLQALQTIHLEGVINRHGTREVHTGFNGKLQVTLYDKPTIINVVDGNSSLPIKYQKSIIFNGFTRVAAGKWSINFQLPLDINYVYGEGLISFYAQADTGIQDANGVRNDSVIIGGSIVTSLDAELPKVKLFMNDFSFISGGTVGPNPLFLARVSDNTGINVSLSGIGHEMVGRFSYAPLDAVVMNSYYVSDVGKPNQGVVKFPLQNLSPGTYKVYFTVWDLYNNSASDSLVFVVQENKDCPQIGRPTVVPNPVLDKAQFQVDNDKPGIPLTATVSVFNTLGQLVFSVTETYTEAPARLGEGLGWQTSTHGFPLSNGLYSYRILTSTPTGCTASATGRVVLNR